MRYDTEFYIDSLFQHFGYADVANGNTIEDCFGSNVAVLEIPKNRLKAFYLARDFNDTSFENWIINEQTADDMEGFFDNWNPTPDKIGFDVYIEKVRKYYKKNHMYLTRNNVTLRMRDEFVEGVAEYNAKDPIVDIARVEDPYHLAVSLTVYPPNDQLDGFWYCLEVQRWVNGKWEHAGYVNDFAKDNQVENLIEQINWNYDGWYGLLNHYLDYALKDVLIADAETGSLDFTKEDKWYIEFALNDYAEQFGSDSKWGKLLKKVENCHKL